MKLYDCTTAPSPRRVRIFLAEKQVSLPTIQVDMRNGEQYSDAFRNINPRCTVPVLELDDGSHLSEVLAICWYIDRCFPQNPLFGNDPAEEARVVMWNAICEQEGVYAVAEAFRNRAAGLKGRALTGPHGYAQIEALAQRGRTRVERFMVDLDERLAQSRFVAGDNFSMADITALVAIDFAGWIKLQVPATHTHLAAWYGVVSERPGASA
ncbi:MAG: glutathione S-transferase [Gammaproteobacteria bacterium]|nr:glutathione S-transferase [Gammaproteobacteria bacterium]